MLARKHEKTFDNLHQFNLRQQICVALFCVKMHVYVYGWPDRIYIYIYIYTPFTTVYLPRNTHFITCVYMVLANPKYVHMYTRVLKAFVVSTDTMCTKWSALPLVCRWQVNANVCM